MKLWTKEIEKKAVRFPIGSQDGKGENAEVIVKFFNPYGSGTWLITEAEKEGDDWLLFGLCDLGFPEYGYVRLSEITNCRVKVGPYRLPLERDLYIGKHPTIKDLR